MIKDEHPAAVKEASGTVLPEWIQAFKALLQIDPINDVANEDNWDGLSIRVQIYKVCFCLAPFRLILIRKT